MTTKKSKPKKQGTNSTIARSDDGTIQINFTIPFDEIKKARKGVLEEFSKTTEVPGFRKGKAPLDKVRDHVPQTSLIEKTLTKMLPKLFSEAIEENKLKPAIYPKFEVIKANEDEDWQIRATTCEMPEINLGDYKKAVVGDSKTKAIWTPDQKSAGTVKNEGQPTEKTKEEKEQEVIKALLENIKIDIPKVMVDQEVDSRLSRLLERVESLGLTLDSYLGSVNKNPQTLRQEYETQARNSLALELILSKIAEEEGVKIDESQVETTLKAASTDPNMVKNIDTPQQRRVIESILKRRAALDTLTALI